jgi:hypothetical protein
MPNEYRYDKKDEGEFKVFKKKKKLMRKDLTKGPRKTGAQAVPMVEREFKHFVKKKFPMVEREFKHFVKKKQLEKKKKEREDLTKGSPHTQRRAESQVVGGSKEQRKQATKEFRAAGRRGAFPTGVRRSTGKK